eukprot:scpid100784/ scgid2382/ 
MEARILFFVNFCLCFLCLHCTALCSALTRVGFNFSTRVMPNWLVFPLKFIITELKFVAQHVGVKTRQNISKAVKEFDLTYIHPRQSILDAGESCIEFGAVTLPANYQPPTTTAAVAASP